MEYGVFDHDENPLYRPGSKAVHRANAVMKCLDYIVELVEQREGIFDEYESGIIDAEERNTKLDQVYDDMVFACMSVREVWPSSEHLDKVKSVCDVSEEED